MNSEILILTKHILRIQKRFNFNQNRQKASINQSKPL